MNPSRRDLLIGGAASAFMPLRIGGQLSRSLDGGIAVDPVAGASSGPSAMTLSIERMTSTQIFVTGTQPSGGVLFPPSGYGDLGLGYDYQVAYNGGSWIQVTEATWHKSRLAMVQGAPPGTPFTVRGRAIDAAGNAGPWATVSSTTPTYTALDRVLLTPLGGRPAYCCYMADVGSAVATISTSVSSATFVSVQCNGYYDSQGNRLTSAASQSPQFTISGGNQLVLSAAPTLSSYWRGGAVGLTFEIQDASLNTYSLSCYLTILCNNPVDVTACPVTGAGHVAVFAGGNLNGSMYIPNGAPLGMIWGTVDYLPPQNGVTGGLPNTWADITQNPGFAFSVEYEQAQVVAPPGGLIAMSGGLNRVRIKQTRPLAAGSYTLQIGIHEMAPTVWFASHHYYAGDFILVTATNTAIWQATSVSGTSSASLSASGLNVTPTVGQVVVDNTVTWQCVALGGSNSGCFLPCLVTIPVVVPSGASKTIAMMPLWSGTLTSCNAQGAHIAQVTGQGGFTPAYFSNLPDPSSVGGITKYAMDINGTLSITPFSSVNQFDANGYGVVTGVSGNNVTIGSGSYCPSWSGVVIGGVNPAFGNNQIVSAPTLPGGTSITSTTGSNPITLSNSAASIPIGSVIRSRISGVSNGCEIGSLACGLDTVVVVALDSSGNVGWLQWNNYVAFPTPQSGHTQYVISGPGASPAANGYRQDSFDGLMADLQNEWNAWSTSSTIPPSAGCSIYVVRGAGENPDGSYTYYGQFSSGYNSQSSPPVPMKIIGIPSANALPTMRWPRLYGGGNVKSLFGNYWDLVFQGFYTDGAYEWWTGTTPNLDTFSQNNGGTGRVVIDLVFACAGDSFVQRGWNLTNQVECSNTMCVFFGSGDVPPPLETFYSLADSLLVSDVYIIGSNVGDVFKSRSHAIFGDNLACFDGNELGGSKLIGAPSGGQWTFGKLTLHRSMQAFGGQVVIANNENWKESRIDQVFSVRDLTLVGDVYYNTQGNSSSQQLIAFGAAAWIGRGVPASMMIGSFKFWSPLFTGPSGHWYTITTVQTGGVTYPPWIQSQINAGSFPGMTLLDGVTPWTLPAMLSARPDLSSFYQGTPMMQALSLALPTPSTPFTSRLMQTPSGGGSEPFVGTWNQPLPLQDIYTQWSGNGASSYLGYGLEPKIPHGASGVVGQALWLPNQIQISPSGNVPSATSSFSFPATGWENVMAIGGATPGITSNSWFTQNFTVGTTASYPQPTWSITGNTQIISAGSGYGANTTVSLTVSGGAFSTPAVLVWNTNSSGGIASLASVTTGGSYTVPANWPATCTGGSGSGFSFNPTWTNTGFSNTLTLSQPTISPVNTLLLGLTPAGATTWNSSTGDLSFSAPAGLAVGDVVRFIGWLPSALNGPQTVTSIVGGTTPHFTISYISGGIVTSGFFVKLPIWELDGVPAADITWGISFINTNTGPATCFTIDSTTGAITYTGGRAAGDWASIWVVATLYGTTYLSYNKVYFVTFT